VTPPEFERIAAPHLTAAFRLAYAFLSDRHQAEDAVQEATLKAWTKIEQLKGGPEQFRPWFLGIVANECRSVRRSRWWSVIKLAESPEHNGDQTAADHAGRMDLWDAVSRLNADDRTILLMRYALDLPLDEVALVLRISVGATKSRLHRALARLRPIVAVEVQP
jgi:RNA polymerase sigma-70 factor (ECF subfamily)